MFVVEILKQTQKPEWIWKAKSCRFRVGILKRSHTVRSFFSLYKSYIYPIPDVALFSQRTSILWRDMLRV